MSKNSNQVESEAVKVEAVKAVIRDNIYESFVSDIASITMSDITEAFNAKSIDFNQLANLVKLKETSLISQNKELSKQVSTTTQKLVKSLKNILKNKTYLKMNAFLTTVFNLKIETVNTDTKMKLFKLLNFVRLSSQYSQLFYKNSSKENLSKEKLISDDKILINSNAKIALEYFITRALVLRKALEKDFNITFDIDVEKLDYSDCYIDLRNESEKES